MAASKAAITIPVAQRSMMRTTGVLAASADSTRRIMRCSELSSPTRLACMSNAPSWLTVPLNTSSPTPLSTGRDSPVIRDWSMAVCPQIITPSTAMLSPGSTRSTSPIFTASAGTTTSPPSRTMRALRGVIFTRDSMPSRALRTVRSSSSEPSDMMKATSPAAKISPIQIAATSAMATNTSALMSKWLISPTTAPWRMGQPHSTMATQAASKGSAPCQPKKLNTREMPPRSASSRCLFSSSPINAFIASISPPPVS